VVEPVLQLKKPRSEAEAVIDRHLGEGRKLLSVAQSFGSEEEYKDWNNDRRRWINLTGEGLKSIYTNSEPAQEFELAASPPVMIGGGSIAQNFEWQQEEIDRASNVLVSLRERLEYLEAPGDVPDDRGREQAPQRDQQIFLVHGHVNGVKEAVGRLLEKTGDHKIVILHEQPSEGRTIIEKFENYAGASDFAVVLLTADDVGRQAAEDGSEPDLRLRARQNVVFELGFFVGRLGRARVAVLYKQGVELPSDFKGVVYIPLDDDSWRYKLLQELRNVGLDYDLNKIPN
jgi:predicted nucleotide-binding protein